MLYCVCCVVSHLIFLTRSLCFLFLFLHRSHTLAALSSQQQQQQHQQQQQFMTPQREQQQQHPPPQSTAENEEKQGQQEGQRAGSDDDDVSAAAVMAHVRRLNESHLSTAGRRLASGHVQTTAAATVGDGDGDAMDVTPVAQQGDGQPQSAGISQVRACACFTLLHCFY